MPGTLAPRYTLRPEGGKLMPTVQAYLESAAFYDRVARYYDAENEHMTEDLELFGALAETQGEPVLDVGCGTGRVMLHLAAAGYRTVGVDVSSAMLERGRRKLAGRADLHGRAAFFEGDAASYPLTERFPLILIPYNGLMHFRTTAEQIALLRHLAAALTADGLLVIDLPNAGERFAGIDDQALTLERTFIEPESGNLVMQQSVSHIDRTAQLQYVTWVYDEIAPDGALRRTVAPQVLRYVFAAELDLLLMQAGLERAARYGDYDESPFRDGCPRLIVLARQHPPR